MNTTMTIQDDIVRTNLDYQAIMSRVNEIEKSGDQSAYNYLLAEAEDLANYIYTLTSDN